MKAQQELAFEVLAGLSPDEIVKYKDLPLVPRSKEFLISLSSSLSELLDKQVIKAREELLLAELEELCIALEAFHKALLTFTPAGELAWTIISSVTTALLEHVRKALSADGEYVLAELSAALRGLADVLNSLRAYGSLRELLEALRALVPLEAGLARYSCLVFLARGLGEDKKTLQSLLAELIAKVLGSPYLMSSKGCFRLEDAVKWCSEVLKMPISEGEIKKALKVLEARGLVKAEEGLYVLRPCEEDLRKALDFAKNLYRTRGLGINERLLSEHMGWCLKYCSKVIRELVNARLLFPGPDETGLGESYYPPPEG